MDIKYEYYNTLTIKSSPTTFEFHGKPNSPNVVMTEGSRMKQYISTKLSISEPSETNSDRELVIEHTLVTNYGKKMLLHFPIKTDTSVKPNIIDLMLSANPGDSLEVNLNTVLPQNNKCILKDNNSIAVFTTPVFINTIFPKKGEPIIEGACGSACDSDIAKLKREMDALKEQQRLASIAPIMGADGISMSSEMMNDILSKNNMKCDALPTGESDNYVAKVLDVDVKSNKDKIDLTNPIAFLLAAIIVACTLYFSVTASYKRIFTGIRQQNPNPSGVEENLIKMHDYEGLVGWILFLFSMILLKVSPRAAGLFLCLWLVYTVVVGISKKNIITDIQGSSYALDEQIKTLMKPMLYNMFIFYPLFPIIFGYAKIKSATA